MARRRRRRYYKSKKVSLEVILALVAFMIFVVFSIIRAIVTGIIHIEAYFVKQNTFLQTAFILGLIGFVLLFAWINNELRNKRKEQLIRLQQERDQEERREILRKRNLGLLKEMDPFEFEEYVACVFRCAGFEYEVTKRTGDGGKDIILRREDELRLVECKRYTTTKVGRSDIQKFHSAIMECSAKEGFFVTTGEFSKQALECASDKPIQTINGEHLLSLIEQYAGFEKEVLEHLVQEPLFVRVNFVLFEYFCKYAGFSTKCVED
ncbi:restriction endonuclease [Paenibacillus sp. BR2-3]|uniref:restriction endonuclease n=1 Tax=Paenibacillus sp. BR2-3 TaxID=3048494 RepID=UPI0039772F51